MSGDFSADPQAVKALGEAYQELGAMMRSLSLLGVDRVALLGEACGGDEDEMGAEIKKNLAPPAAKIEDALLAISEVVKNQTNVMNGLANRIAATENENIANVGRHVRR